jgi:hypothetical protein
MTLESIFIDPRGSYRQAPDPPRRVFRAISAGAFTGPLMECIPCRSCHAIATLYVDINPGPRSHRSTRVRYFRCKICHQVEVVEVGVQ